jgi:hypothetical protein
MWKIKVMRIPKPSYPIQMITDQNGECGIFQLSGKPDNRRCKNLNPWLLRQNQRSTGRKYFLPRILDLRFKEESMDLLHMMQGFL